MKYRSFGKIDWKVSTLGFGAMRLPIVNKKQSDIDEAEASKMIHHAIDQGVNYIDTAYVYHNGNSESFVGNVLQNGYRDKVKIATKLPPWFVGEAKDFDKLLNEQLKRLQTDHIDFYLLHGMDSKQWPRLRDLNVLEWAEKAKADGRISHLGFSFHDVYEVFQEIIDAYDKWEMCQIQYNFMDTEFQAGKKGLKYAADKEIPIVIMEPLRGGQLAKTPPESISTIMQELPVSRTPADLALQWLWNQPEVTTVLSGMTTMQHVTENLNSACISMAGSLNDEELNIISRINEKYLEVTPIPCTGCKYCMPCPNEVDISRILEVYNDAIKYDDIKRSRFIYKNYLTGQPADKCDECFECEELCPQEIPITEWLKTCHKELGPKT